MNNQAAEKSKRKAEGNPWYLLATVYGVPDPLDEGLRQRNRVAWNRYMLTVTKVAVPPPRDTFTRGSNEFRRFEPSELHALEIELTNRAGEDIKLPLFPFMIGFDNVEFDRDFSFAGYLFPTETSFQNASFLGTADFSNSIFYREIFFVDALFQHLVRFDNSTFGGWAYFMRASLHSADFENTRFSGESFFDDAVFFDELLFSTTQFSAAVSFKNAIFHSLADFHGVLFAGSADFSNATFRSLSVFANADMKSITLFDNASFVSSPPQFAGAKLHEGTVWRNVKWPPPPTTAEAAGRFLDAYERLKLEMDRLKKHEDELDFFAREMQSRRVLYGNWKRIRSYKVPARSIALPRLRVPALSLAIRPRKLFKYVFAPPTLKLPAITFKLPTMKIPELTIPIYGPAGGLPISAYGHLCEYGRSYVRPLIWLLVTVAVGTLLFLPHFDFKFGRAVGISLANTFGILGFRKDFINVSTLTDLSNALIFVAGVQTIIGAVLIFLFGLALRNRFRMR